MTTPRKPDQPTGSILLVEDDPVTAKILSGWLRGAGWREVVVACDGPEGARLAQQGRWDIALIDIGLPSMNGLELLRIIKSAVPWMPAVIMTANPSVTAVLEALSSKADDFVAKPIIASQLIDKVRRLISHAFRAPAPA